MLIYVPGMAVRRLFVRRSKIKDAPGAYGGGIMSDKTGRKLLWAARILAIFLSAFLLLFSFDVFEGDEPLLYKLGGFVMHSLPSITIWVFLALFWSRPKLAAIAWLVIGVGFAVRFRNLPAILMVSLPTLIISALFYLAHVAMTGKRESS